MNVLNEFILGLFQIKGLGRKTIFSLARSLEIKNISNEADYLGQINEIRSKNVIKKLRSISNKEIENGIDRARQIIDNSYKNGVQILSFWDTDFPAQLRFIEDPPVLIHTKGNYSILNELYGIAIIGTREPSIEGIKAGKYFGKFFAQSGFNIVSGLAKGCDFAGHLGALSGNGKTTAVLAHGLQTIYPKENIKLADDIVSYGGVLISEYPFGTSAKTNFFVERDRLQSGLSIATIVIQAGLNSGTMHAVNATIKSNKILAAVQYNDEGRLYDKVIGNQELINTKRAIPLKSSNVNELLERVKDYIKDNSFE